MLRLLWIAVVVLGLSSIVTKMTALRWASATLLVLAAGAIIWVTDPTTCHVDQCGTNVLVDALILLAGFAAAFFVLVVGRW